MRDEVKATVGGLNRKDEKVRLLFDVLTDRMEGRITEEVFNDMVLRWSFHYALTDLRNRPLPMMPEKVRDFYDLPEGKRRKLFDEDGRVKATILSYRSDYLKKEAVNKSNLNWLKKMEEHFKLKDDVGKLTKIKEVVDRYAEVQTY